MSHRFTFFRAGGFNQVVIGSGADLMNLDQLDQKLWVALACPTRGLEFDSRTLDLIDTDKDGRVRAPEIIAAAIRRQVSHMEGVTAGAESQHLGVNKATVLFYSCFHIRERNIKENRFRFSLNKFWRLARLCLRMAAGGAKSFPCFLAPQAKFVSGGADENRTRDYTMPLCRDPSSLQPHTTNRCRFRIALL